MSTLEPNINPFLSSNLINLAQGIVILCLIVWFGLRAGSTVAMLDRLWRLTIGKEEKEDLVLRKHLEKNRAIEKFKFIHQVQVDSIEEMHKFIHWLQKYSITALEVKRSKRWIDISSKKILKLPNKLNEKTSMTVMGISMILLIISTVPLAAKSALLQFKESKVRFLMNQDTARGLTEDWVLNQETCEKVKTNGLAIDLNTQDTNSICESFKEGKTNKFISDAITEQKKMGFMLMVLFGVLGANSLKRLVEVSAAKNVRSKIEAYKKKNKKLKK